MWLGLRLKLGEKLFYVLREPKKDDLIRIKKMFTGIVEETGTINSILQKGNSLVLGINCSFAGDLALGESVAVNGVCLTVTKKTQNVFYADVTPETFRRTGLGELKNGSSVNLERALKSDGRFGGHIVSGHIDGTGFFVSCEHEENAKNIKIAVNSNLGKYIIEKGSICIDGISLTVANVNYGSEETVFEVAVIPHTWEQTTLSKKSNGDKVNIECDLVGKYIEHFLNWPDSKKNVFSEEQTIDDETLNSFMSSCPSFH